MSEPRSVSVTADGLRYTGLEWGPQDGEPIMALHGWLDNALSFSVVAPKLAGYRVVALDLSGQGFSDHRSPDATYHIWDDIPQLLSIADHLGFEKMAVAGHSRGAAIAVLLASALRERCSHLVLLDGMLPHPLKEENVPSQFEQAQIDHRELSAYRGRIFKDIEEYVAARRRLGFSEQSARLIAPRAIVETSDGFRLTHDPRLNHASAIKLTSAMCSAFYSALSAPTLALIAENGLRARAGLADAVESVSEIPDCVVESVPGGHHTHMEEGAQWVAECITRFLRSR